MSCLNKNKIKKKNFFGNSYLENYPKINLLNYTHLMTHFE